MTNIDAMTSNEWQAYRRDKVAAHYAQGLELTPEPTCASCDVANDYVCFECELNQLGEAK